MHEECIDPRTRPHLTCPMCRNDWHQASEELVTLEESLDPDAVQMSLDWLYTGRLQFPKNAQCFRHDHAITIFKAWTVSDVMQDAAFRHDLVADIMSKTLTEFPANAMEYIFVTKSSRTMRRFFVDLMLASHEPDHLVAKIPDLPTALTQAICRSLFKSAGTTPTRKDVVDTHTCRTYLFQGPYFPGLLRGRAKERPAGASGDKS
jgi:hypothetical protein